MEVNDCHLQFFDSLGNLIYEFDLDTIIALNNGNGILIKDDLTTLTIDNNIVVDNLEMTIAELITYIQEQRVLCDCCGSTPAEAVVSSATWGFDFNGALFYVKQMSNGSVVYESPIGTVAVPTGFVGYVSTLNNTLSFSIIETNTSGNLPAQMTKWKIDNIGGAAGSVSGGNFPHTVDPLECEGVFINQLGQWHDAAPVAYDATGTDFYITYSTY